MKTKIVFLFVAAFFSSTVIFSQHVDLTIHFGNNDYVPDNANHELVRDWCIKNRSLRDEQIMLRGHTDSDAATNYNNDLGAKRNEAVAEMLTAHGFRIHLSKSFGETWPLNSNSTDEEKAMNRRVELIVMNRDEEKFSCGSSHEVPQIFFGHSASAIEICGKNGIRITVNPNGLMTKGGTSYTGDVRFELREFYNVSDFLLNKLSTSANGLLLGSGGTIEIKCYISGTSKELIPAPGNPAEIRFASIGSRDSMSIFLGNIVSEVLMNTTYERLNWNDSIRIDVNEGWPANISRWMGHEPKSPQPSVGVKEYGINFTQDELARRKRIEDELVDFKMVSVRDFYKSDSVVFRTPSFGWINCDKYMQYGPDMLVNVPISVDQVGMMEAYIVLPQEMAVMPFTIQMRRMAFASMPRNKDAVIVVLDQSGNTLRFAMKEVVCDGTMVEKSTEVATMDEVRVQLQTLNEFRKNKFSNIKQS